MLDHYINIIGYIGRNFKQVTVNEGRGLYAPETENTLHTHDYHKSQKFCLYAQLLTRPEGVLKQHPTIFSFNTALSVFLL